MKSIPGGGPPSRMTLAEAEAQTQRDKRRILVLISENRTSREIAEELFLSVRTVQNHRHHICGKLGLSGFHSLLQFALEHKTALMGFLPSRSAP